MSDRSQLTTISPAAPTVAWRCLSAGLPLTLLIDLAAGERLDSAALLQDEEVAALAGSAWAQTEQQAAARGRSARVS
jgi:hypothetical protein